MVNRPRPNPMAQRQPDVPKLPKTPDVLKWVALSNYGMEPTRREGDAGYDLYVSDQTVLAPRIPTNVPSGIAVELPGRLWGMLVPRSSTLRRGIHVQTGIIDNGYRGELFVAAENLTGENIVLEPGERIAQFILMPLIALPVVQVNELSQTERGANGFGSTGR